MKLNLVAAIVFLISSGTIAQERTLCGSIQDCAQKAMEAAEQSKIAVAEVKRVLGGRVTDLEAQLAKANMELDKLSKEVKDISAKIPKFVSYGAKVYLHNPEGYLTSQNHRKKDELDLIISEGRSPNAYWALLPP